MTLACDIVKIKECMTELKALLGGDLTIDWSTFPQGIEVSALQGACVYDTVLEKVVGKVSLCKVVDEADPTDVTFKPIAFRADGSIENPFVLGANEELDFTCGGAAQEAALEAMLEKLCEIRDALVCKAPAGDPVFCSTVKLGADFTSGAAGSGTHTAGSLYDGPGTVTTWNGSFKVEDSAGTIHNFADGATVTGMASGATGDTTFTGSVSLDDGDGNIVSCDVVDKIISAQFTVS